MRAWPACLHAAGLHHIVRTLSSWVRLSVVVWAPSAHSTAWHPPASAGLQPLQVPCTLHPSPITLPRSPLALHPLPCTLHPAHHPFTRFCPGHAPREARAA